MRAAQLDELGERRGVAAHRVDAVDDHALPGLGGQLGEDLRQALEVVVPEALHRGARELHAREQRVVHVLVEDHVVVTVQDAADRAHVRDVAGGEHQRRLAPEVVGQLGFELAVEVERPVQQP